MRKSLIIIAVLLALSIGVIVSAAVTMDARHECIAITEETLYGDPAAAAGLSVSTRVHNDHHLFWDTTYQVCADPRPETVFSYSDAPLYEQGEPEGHFAVETAYLNCGMSGTIDLEQEMENNNAYSDSTGLWYMVKDVADRTEPGEEHTELVNLIDYYATFPIDFSFDPYKGMEYWEGHESFTKYLNRIFPIPVPEELRLNVTICKDEEGNIYNIDYYEEDPGAAEVTYVWSPSVVLYDGVFFGMVGNVDFSQFPDGYGLYYLPIAENDKINAINRSTGETVHEIYLTQRIKNIYPMDPADSEEGSLWLSADRKQVYAITKEQGEYILTVFDSQTCEILQQLKPGINQIPTLWQQDNIVALVTRDEAWENFFLQVYLVEDGKLTLWLDTELFQEGDSGPYWYVDTEMAYDGERLAIVQYHDSWDIATHQVLIYDQTGLLYAGDFHHSGDDLPDRLITWDGGLQIKWD